MNNFMNGKDFAKSLEADLLELRKDLISPAQFARAVASRLGSSSAGSKPDYPARGTWAWDYAWAITEHLYHSVRRDPKLSTFREKSTRPSEESLEGIWDHLVSLGAIPITESSPGRSYGEVWFLSFGEERQSIALPKQGSKELRQLGELINYVVREYRVSEAWALVATLTDNLMPLAPVRPITSRFEPATEQYLERLVLSIDPAMPAKEISDYYRSAKAQITKRGRSITRKQLQLLRLAAREPELSWPELMNHWERSRTSGRRSATYKPQQLPPTGLSEEEANAAYERWSSQRRNALSNFRRDVNTAWQVIFGSKPPKRSEISQRDRDIAQQMRSKFSSNMTEKENE